MNRNAWMNLTAAVLMAVILFLQIDPVSAGSDSGAGHSFRSNAGTVTSDRPFYGMGNAIPVPYAPGLSGIYGNPGDKAADSGAADFGYPANGTDGQNRKTVLSAVGDGWEITVTYGEDAKIPDGAELKVREISEGSDEYESRCELAIKALSEDHDDKDYLVGLNDVRFFDICLFDREGQRIEPEAPVIVEIHYADPIEVAGNDSLKVVHFGEAETEIIPIETAKGPVTEIVYTQNGFSVIGMVSETNAYGWPTVANAPYVMLLQDGEDYYAVSHDGTLRKVYYLNGTVAFMGPGTTTEAYLDDYLWNYSVVSSTRHTARLSSYGTDPVSYIDPYYGILHPEIPDAVIGSSQRTLNISNNRIYASYYNTNYTLSAQGGVLHRTTLNADDASPIFFAALDSFTADSSESEIYDFINIDVLINKWKNEMTQDLIMDKTAEVYDYPNRIYQVDLMASSGYHLISPALALEFVVDASRSMFFPENLYRVQVNGNDYTYSSMTGLRDFFTQLDPAQRDTVYYVITDKNNKATNYAIFYHDANKYPGLNMNSGWYYVDASYYYPPDNLDGSYPNTGSSCRSLYGSNLGSLNDGYIYTSDEKVAGRPWSRLDYMQIAVEAASRVLFAVDPDAQIGLVTFNNKTVSYGPFTASQINDLVSALYNISLEGGTNHVLGLNQAVAEFTENFENVDNCQTAVVLITDGAPNGKINGNNITWTDIQAAAAEVKAMENAYGQNTRLFTLGLSLENIGSNKDYLAAISTEPHSDFAFSAEQSTEVVHFITKIIEGLTIDANLIGSVTDVIDAGFYPVDPDTGIPLASGTWITAEGKVTEAGADDAAGQVIGADGVWRVEWRKLQIDWPTYTDSSRTQIADHGWNGRIYVKAQEDFLGGNDIPTNAAGSQVEALRYINPRTGETADISGGDAERIKVFDTPYVNVDELLFDENGTEWTVYLGETVDPKKQLESLFGLVNVYEVVKDDGSLAYTLSPGSVTNLPEDGKSRTGDTFPLSEVIGDLTENDWDRLIGGETIETDYEAYGHIPGVITLSLTQTVAEGEDDLTPSPHTTAVAGDDVEKYELTISYLPFAPAIADYHTGTKDTGSHGAPTDNIVSDNVHEINVYIHKLEIEKTDQDGNPLPGAVFTLYKADDEHGEAVAGLDSAHKYTEAAAAVSGADGIARLKHGSEDFGPALGETYYLIETAAPEGYTMESTVRTVEVQAENGKYTDLNGNAIASDTGITDAMYPFNWDQDARILLDGNPAAVITKGEAGSAATTVTDGAYVSHDSVISFRHTVINTPMTAAITIYGAKVLEGRAMTEDDVFTFELVPAQQVTGRYPGLPESNVLTVQNNADGVFSFTLSYDYTDFAAAQVNNKATFTYLVTEKPPEGVIPGETDPNTGMQYSTQQFWVQVDLEMAEGELRVSGPRVYIKSPPPAAGTLTRKNEPLRNRA